MSVDVINIGSERIKRYALDLYNKANQSNIEMDVDRLTFESVGDDKVMLQDTVTKRGVLISKISLQSLFPNVIDLRPFKHNRLTALGIMHPTNAAHFNEKHEATLVDPEINILKSSTGFPIEDIKEFILFCRVFGFYELDIGDVTLIRSNDTLYISVNDTHALYTGVLEVKV